MTTYVAVMERRMGKTVGLGPDPSPPPPGMEVPEEEKVNDAKPWVVRELLAAPVEAVAPGVAAEAAIIAVGKRDLG